MRQTPKFREKAKVIEARVFDGDQAALMDVVNWIRENGYTWFDLFTPVPASGVGMEPTTGFLLISNKSRVLHSAQKGDWVIKRVDGDFTTMTKAAFTSTYKHVDGSMPTTEVAPDPAQKSESPASGVRE